MRSHLSRRIEDQALAAWQDAHLDDLNIRMLEPSDLDAIATTLQLGEGYTQTDAPTESWDAIRRGLVGFGEDGVNDGLVATGDGFGGPAAFLLFRRRSRATDDFGEGHVIGALARTLFPADGRFLQVHELWVAPPARRRGIGQALKKMLEAMAASEGVGMIYTVTEVGHRASIALNQQLGYVEIYRGPMWDEVPRVALAKYIE